MTADGGGVALQHLGFPIDSGTHSPFTCTDCHTDLANPTDPTTLACTTCHTGSHDQLVMQTQHSVAPGVGALYQWSTPACLTCHPQDTVLTRSAHGGEADRDDHNDVACSQCHPAQTDLTPTTFSAIQCTPCHDGVPGGDDGGDDD